MKTAGPAAVCAAVLALSAAAGEPAPPQGNVAMEVRTYQSSQDPALKLTAEFHVPAEARPLCLFFHGWHQTAAVSRKEGYIAKLSAKFFVVNVDMRGRGGGTGTPDASGFELIDGLDALDFARQTWPAKVDGKSGPYVVGGSGGGGNTLALVGKAPDVFAAAAEWAGMSDYALWHGDDKAGQYRDEMEGKGWIGGSPESNPEGYLSRGGLHLLPNVISPLLVVHGTKDTSVPPHHAEKYKQRAEELRKTNISFHFWNAGHSSEDFPRFLDFLSQHAAPPKLPEKGTLLVHSFLACRSFRLLLDHPSRVGSAEYQLSADGALRSLVFAQPAKSAPAKEFVLRLAGDVKAITLEAQGGRRIVERASQAGAWSDFRWAADGAWTARTPADTVGGR
ncbi:MAG TPA: prolyl oligopeptidase family serine peptidase [Planctomycetota bacterium]|nr:prolyl oligopeptidase family serine peptidase [Planctomycetota bacterium]